MERFYFIRWVAIALCLLLATVAGCSRSETETDENNTPHIGQAGKDVIWVPTPQMLVNAMLDMANVTSSDYVIDLGSGDGRLVIAAAKRGATALGIEFNPDLVEFSRDAAAKEGVTAKAMFEKADIFESDFSKATVITMYLLPAINLKLRPKILNMKPGTRIVSNTFGMAGWEPDQTTSFWGSNQTTELEENNFGGDAAYLWIVPANVDGTWKIDEGIISFKQNFQNVTGTLTMGKDMKLAGKLNGDKISFNAGGTEYTGTVSGNTISGTRAGGGAWKAVR